ncbi:hypothetical protein GF402_10890 [Candidatus Fermentibacteria bacterium]|nr:hypothetical protein [Candidatus Fermentibacteria bacterium]
MGCLVTGACILVLVVLAWKCIDFFILTPASLEAEIGDVYDQIRLESYRTPDLKMIKFQELWSDHLQETDLGLNTSGPRLRGDTMYMEYRDTLYFPVFGAYAKTFEVDRLFK